MSATEGFSEMADRLRREREEAPVQKQRRHVAVAITGTRERAASGEEMAAFRTVWRDLGANELHHGDATGIDRYVAAEVRNEPGVKIVAHPADWYPAGRPRSLGADKGAGPRRNREMLLQVEALIAFPGGRGTQSCIRIARSLGKPVHFVGEHVLPQPRVAPARKAEHQHDPSSWQWDPDRAVWIGRCISCHSYFEASPEEARQLEADAAEWADQHPV